jgi:DNA-binding beta-propeller fold protein YncE
VNVGFVGVGNMGGPMCRNIVKKSNHQVTVFDLKTLAVLGRIKLAARNPDAIEYDPASKRVFVFNGGSANASVIDASANTLVGSVPLDGKPEFAAADGKGVMYVNLEDSSAVVAFDTHTLKLLHRWPLAPCQEPSGLAIDRKNHRLFAGCDNKMMAVVDGETGKIVATLAIGEGVDANAFDPATNYAFASTGDGHLTVVHEDAPDKYAVIENVSTKKSARTMGLDLKTHAIFLPSADFDAPAAGERRGKMKPGSFAVLVLQRR